MKQATSEIARLSKIVPGGESFEKRNEAKVFVGHLTREVKSSDMRAYFKNFGTVLDAFIIHKNPAFPCGFVEFANKEDAVKALESRPHIMLGRRIVVDKCRVKRRYAGKENSSPVKRISPKHDKYSSRNHRYSPY